MFPISLFVRLLSVFLFTFHCFLLKINFIFTWWQAIIPGDRRNRPTPGEFNNPCCRFLNNLALFWIFLVFSADLIEVYYRDRSADLNNLWFFKFFVQIWYLKDERYSRDKQISSMNRGCGVKKVVCLKKSFYVYVYSSILFPGVNSYEYVAC
jgi:hypothetical protein